MLMPVLPPRKTDPEEVIREIEDDPMTQFVWDLIPKLANAVQGLKPPVDEIQRKPVQRRAGDC